MNIKVYLPQHVQFGLSRVIYRTFNFTKKSKDFKILYVKKGALLKSNKHVQPTYFLEVLNKMNSIIDEPINEEVNNKKIFKKHQYIDWPI